MAERSSMPHTAKDTPPPWRTPPALWAGSAPEWAVYWALEKLGYQPNVDFFHQSPSGGGRSIQGGAVLDFYLPALGIALRVQGTYWHYGRGGDTRALDLIQKIQLEGRGIRVIDLDEDDVLKAPLPVVRNALGGIDTSRTAR